MFGVSHQVTSKIACLESWDLSGHPDRGGCLEGGPGQRLMWADCCEPGAASLGFLGQVERIVDLLAVEPLVLQAFRGSEHARSSAQGVGDACGHGAASGAWW